MFMLLFLGFGCVGFCWCPQSMFEQVSLLDNTKNQRSEPENNNMNTSGGEKTYTKTVHILFTARNLQGVTLFLLQDISCRYKLPSRYFFSETCFGHVTSNASVFIHHASSLVRVPLDTRATRCGAQLTHTHTRTRLYVYTRVHSSCKYRTVLPDLTLLWSSQAAFGHATLLSSTLECSQ